MLTFAEIFQVLSLILPVTATIIVNIKSVNSLNANFNEKLLAMNANFNEKLALVSVDFSAKLAESVDAVSKNFDAKLAHAMQSKIDVIVYAAKTKELHDVINDLDKKQAVQEVEIKRLNDIIAIMHVSKKEAA